MTKDEPVDVLQEAIRKVAGGEPFFSAEVRKRLVVDTKGGLAVTGGTSPRLATLTVRELEVLRMIGEGMRKKEIAGKLFRSEKTIQTHVEKIMRKLDINDRVALARFAIREGLVNP